MNTKRSLVKTDPTASGQTTTIRRVNGMAAVRQVIVVAAVCCVSFSTTGCCSSGCDPLRMGQACDNWHSNKMTRLDACLAWGGCQNRCAKSEFAPDIKRGFVAGYMATCMGGDGRIPMVPERRYWSNWYRCKYGQRCINAWYMGYPMGVNAARQRGYHRLEAPEITLAQWRDPATFTRMTPQPEPAPRAAPAEPPVHRLPPRNDDVLQVPEAPSQPGTFAVPVTPVPQTQEDAAPEPPANPEYDPPQAMKSPEKLKFKDSTVSILPDPKSVSPVPATAPPEATDVAPGPGYVVPQQTARRPEPRHILPDRSEEMPQANVPHNYSGPGGWEELPPEFSGRGSVSGR